MMKRVLFTLAAVFIEDHTRWVLWVPVFIGLGIGIYFSLPLEPPLFFGIGATLSFAVFAWVFRNNPAVFPLIVVLFAISSGHLAAQIRTVMVDHVALMKETGPTRITGRIVQLEPKTSGIRLVLDRTSIAGLEPYDTPDKVRITTRIDDNEPVTPGDWITLRTILRPPSAPVAPGAFDFQRYAFFKGIGATGFSFGSPEIKQRWSNTPTSENMSTWLARFRLLIGERIRSTIGEEEGALAAALITGERLAILKQYVTDMRNAGLAHLLAISGLHIGLVAGLVFFLVRAVLALLPTVAVRYPIKGWAALAALGVAFFYTLLAGSTIPTLRSFLMMALILGAVMIGRRAISMRSVALAATIVLLIRPESLLGPSFQLSFAAVIALVAAYEWISKNLPTFWKKGTWYQRLMKYIGGVALTTLIAGLATAPFSAFHFHHLAAYSLIANLIAVPLTALCIMPSALLAILLMPFGLDQIPLSVMGLGVEGLLLTAHTVSHLPGNQLYFPAMPLSALVLISIGGLWLCLWQKPWRLGGTLGCIIGMVVFSHTSSPVVLASENAQIFALSTSEGFYIVGPGKRGNRYTRTTWLERAGYDRQTGISALKSGVQATQDQDTIRCDHMGCILTLLNGQKISVVWDEGALLEDCWSMDAIISAVPVRRRCDAPLLVVDRFDLWRHGAYAIYADENSISVENVNALRGNRPWTRRIPRSTHSGRKLSRDTES